MSAIENYRVVSPAGAVVEDATSSVFYPVGATFHVSNNNPSIRRHLSSHIIISAAAVRVAPVPVPRTGGGVGPTGPTGLPGGPAGSLHSVKIRTVPFTYPMSLSDTGSEATVSWPSSTEALYNEAHMFNQITNPTQIVIKNGGAGRYHISASVTFEPNLSGARLVTATQYDSLGVYKDHSTITLPAISGMPTSIIVSGDFNCVSGDYFELSYRQTSGAPISAAASFSARLSGSGDRGPQGPSGADGADGADGEDGAVGVVGPEGPRGVSGVVWRGNWNATVSYKVHDTVSFLGSSFIAVEPNLNDPPLSPSWLILAAHGVAGPQGPQGPPGKIGPDDGIGS